jgi:GntR family transcriptional regulator
MVPRYLQIAEDLRQQIEAGESQPGAPLPTELELQKKYEASRNTVRDAIKWLTARGLVETRPGQGTFAVERVIPLITNLTDEPLACDDGEIVRYDRDVMGRRRTVTGTPPQVAIQQADVKMASELRIGIGWSVVSRHQQRFIDGTPWSLHTSYYPMRLVEHGAVQLLDAVNVVMDAISYLRDSIGIQQAGYHHKIIVRAPEQDEGSFFRLPDDQRISVIENRQIVFSEDGSPIELTVSVYPADRNQLAVNIGVVPVELADEPPSSEATDSR